MSPYSRRLALLVVAVVFVFGCENDPPSTNNEPDPNDNLDANRSARVNSTFEFFSTVLDKKGQTIAQDSSSLRLVSVTGSFAGRDSVWLFVNGSDTIRHAFDTNGDLLRYRDSIVAESNQGRNVRFGRWERYPINDPIGSGLVIIDTKRSVNGVFTRQWTTVVARTVGAASISIRGMNIPTVSVELLQLDSFEQAATRYASPNGGLMRQVQLIPKWGIIAKEIVTINVDRSVESTTLKDVTMK